MGRYVALRTMQVQGDDGLMVSVTPGQDIPKFASWPYPVQKAHLDLGNVRDNDKLAPVFSNGRVIMATHPSETPTLMEIEDTVVAPSPLPNRIKCPSCDHAGFATTAAYKRHFLRAHRGH